MDSPPPSDASDSSSSPPPSSSHSLESSTFSSPPPPSESDGKGTPISPLPPQSGYGDHSTTPSSQNLSATNNSANVVYVVGVLASVGVLIIMFVAVILVTWCRRKKNKSHDCEVYYNEQGHHAALESRPAASGCPAPPTDTSGAHEQHDGFHKNTFTYDELAGATQGFSEANVLGQGGFGFVHKGVLPNGKEIAVKSLKLGSGQGQREFQAEVDIISRVHHRHLVSLVGYCMAGEQRMLVYEFVPNKTLEFHLHGNVQPAMNFPLRLKIALGSAKGLAYLHEDCHPRIFHRDIKTANILIDHAFEAKVADFGLAKFANDNNMHVSTRVMGTFGYLAPEYAASGKLTEKSDVFSFGVVLLELITGRRPINPTGDEDGLVDWARPQLARVVNEGNFDGVVDPGLDNNFNPQEMTRLVACAAAAIRHSAKRRPKMSQIVRALEGDASLEALNERVKPRQTMHFAAGESSSGEYTTSSSEYGASSRSS